VWQFMVVPTVHSLYRMMQKNDILLTLLPYLFSLTYKQYLIHNVQAYIWMISVSNFTCLAQTVNELVTESFGASSRLSQPMKPCKAPKRLAEFHILWQTPFVYKFLHHSYLYCHYRTMHRKGFQIYFCIGTRNVLQLALLPPNWN